MNFNVEPYLISLLAISFVLALVDIFRFAPTRRQRYIEGLKELSDFGSVEELSVLERRKRTFWRFIIGRLDTYPEVDAAAKGVAPEVLKKCQIILQPKMIFDYARSLFPIFLLVVLIRSFIFEPYLVPTGSLEPTVLPGDFLLVSKYSYGLKVPLTRYTFFETSVPARGDIIVFRYPPDPSINYVKRLIGVPGDKISYQNKVLTVNGVKAAQVKVKSDRAFPPVYEYEENLTGVMHDILINRADPAYNFKDLVVPEGYYFMMGDNRDNSLDSRFWGFVPERDLVGKAKLIWLSKIPGQWAFRWSRTGIMLEG